VLLDKKIKQVLLIDLLFNGTSAQKAGVPKVTIIKTPNYKEH
jgi:hypothetical protein